MRPVTLMEVTYSQLASDRPNVAVLPWGATEAHNQHLPFGTDTLEGKILARRAAEIAQADGARVIVLPPVPFGNNAQQLDQIATIHIGTATAMAILRDVVSSLQRQGITRLVLLNAHGGNDFKALVRDIMMETGVFVALVNFWQMCPDLMKATFKDPGDHAGAMETSLLLHWCPEVVQMKSAGKGERRPFAVEALNQKGVWTPRPWSRIHPDLGSGDPSEASAEKGRIIADAISLAIAEVITGISKAKDLP